MPVGGVPKLWSRAFPAEIIPQMVELVEDSWQTFDQPKKKEIETRITKRFRCHLVLRKNALRTLPVRILREDPEDDFEAGVEKGRVDIRFVHAFNCREDVYFAFECKRLNVPSGKSQKLKALSGDYVKKGMMRFVKGQYASIMRHGGMIGYVMNGHVAVAINAVKKSVVRERKALKMRAHQTLCGSMMVPGKAHVQETFHSLGRRAFRIQHVFLQVA
jgi:hypothetical protein